MKTIAEVVLCLHDLTMFCDSVPQPEGAGVALWYDTVEPDVSTLLHIIARLLDKIDDTE